MRLRAVEVGILHSMEPAMFSATVPGRTESLRPLRHSLREWLATAEVEPATADDVVLAAWEVCANALEHPVRPRHPPEVRVRVTVSKSYVRVSVQDTGEWRVRTVRRAHRGLGLRLARALMDRVSILRDRTGTEVVMWRYTSRRA